MTELVKLGYSPKYWRTKTGVEVDFIIEKGNEIIPIEVKINNPNRLERNLVSFIDIYKPKRAFIVSYKGESKTIKYKNCEIFFTDVLDMEKIIKE